VVSVASVAFAQPTALYPRDPEARPINPQPLPTRSAWDRAGMLGFELELRGVFMYAGGESPALAPNLYSSNISGNPTGDILQGTEAPYGYDPFGLSLAAGYRFLPYLSAGAFFTYAAFLALDNTDTGDYKDSTSQLQRKLWTLGAYARYYLTTLSSRLQPWVDLGFGYSDDTASYTRIANQGSAGGPAINNYYIEEKGLIVPLNVGLDWRLAPVFSVGPTLGYARVFPLSGCVQVDADPRSPVQSVNTCDSSVVNARGYGVFYGGIYLKVTIGPPAR
jgi:hypothetical protein